MRLHLWLAVPLILSLTRGDVERAVQFARWPHTDAERSRFHARYITKYAVPPALAGPAVESIEVITEYRRLETMAEAHEQIHDMWARGGAIQEAVDALKPFRDRVSIVAHVQFGALTVTVPDVVVALGGATAPRRVADKMRPIYVRDAIVGGDFESIFESAAIGQSSWIVIVQSNGTEIARTSINFGALE